MRAFISYGNRLSLFAGLVVKKYYLALKYNIRREQKCRWNIWCGAGVVEQRALGGAAARALVRVAARARAGGRRPARRAGAAGLAAGRAARGPQPRAAARPARAARAARRRRPRRRPPRPGATDYFIYHVSYCFIQIENSKIWLQTRLGV